MSDIGRQFQNVSFSPNIFTPYPGIPIWPQLREMHVPEPKNLREWGEVPLGANLLPWLQGQELSRFQRMLDYFLLSNQLRRKKVPGWSGALMRAVLQRPILWRIRSSHYEFPWELRVSRSMEKLVRRRSLVTGQQLPTESVA
jgi:hypothetical protein